MMIEAMVKEATAKETPPAEQEHTRAEVRPAATVATVEHVLYALVLLVGLGARVLLLGGTPLSPAEAAAAWPAWLDAQGLAFANVHQPVSALLHSLQLFLFWLLGHGSDGLARLPVALISALIPLLPWFWRMRLGRTAALVLALLLALDPWLLALGRTAESTLLSVTLGLITLTALHRFGELDDGAESWAGAIAAGAAGLLLASGPQAWSWLAVVVLYGVLLLGERARGLLTLRPLLVLAAALVLGATGWLANPGALAMIGASLSRWLALLDGGPFTLLWPLLRLVVDQPFVLVLGGAGLWRLWRGRAALGERLFVSIWLGWALLLLVLPGREAAMLPLLGVPLALLAALAVQEIVRAAQAEQDWREAGLLALVLGIILLSTLFWATALIWTTPFSARLAAITVAMVLLAVLLAAGFGFLVSTRQALVLAGGLVGAALLAGSLSATVKLAFDHDPSRPDGFFAQVANANAGDLAADVAALSDRRRGLDSELEVQVVLDASQTPDPQVGWLLRRMRNLRFVAAPVPGSPVTSPTLYPLVITQGSSEAETWNAAYTGAEYRLRESWLPSELPALSGYATNEEWWVQGARPWLRWLTKRQAGPAQPETVVLWATP